MEVPNFDMMLHERQFAEFMSDHLCYFTADTLTTALSINGFEVLECTEEFHRYILSAVVRKRGRLDLSDFHAQQARLRDEIHAYIRRFSPKRVAIWGAGHQALALMSLLDLSTRSATWWIRRRSSRASSRRPPTFRSSPRPRSRRIRSTR